MQNDLERRACEPEAIDVAGFNPHISLPYGLEVDHVRQAMERFIDFLGFINQQLHSRGLSRLESLMMPANFSSLVGEFMKANIPDFCKTLVENQYHNGHPDLIPAGRFPNNAVQHTNQGIEVKASRYNQGWQGHNPEEVWLMVFVFDSNRPGDTSRGILPKPFRFRAVYCAHLEKTDWSFSGRSNTSRRTITASVTQSGRKKLVDNWIYRAPSSSSVNR